MRYVIFAIVDGDLRPISAVDGQGFTRLLNYLEPGYKVPSRSHVTRICHKMFDSPKELGWSLLPLSKLGGWSCVYTAVVRLLYIYTAVFS